MSAARIVEPELLDALAADDPRAVRSRRDLKRVNRLMAAASLLGKPLDTMMRGRTAPVRLIELGAGDGTLLLRVAQRYAASWPAVQLGLLDMQPVVEDATLQTYRSLGWEADVIRADVFDWLAQADNDPLNAPILCANLFLHHFDGDRLACLLSGIATRASGFVCIEPRRSTLALVGSHLLGAVGCNDVTRHDAVVSVRAGFTGEELSTQWPRGDRWQHSEHGAGLFSHRLVATRSALP